jgi:hypothetical protein
VSTRSNSLTNLLSAVKAGLGIGMLPCFVGDAESDIRRCMSPVPVVNAEVWLIVREDIRQAPHVRAFVDSLAAHMHGLRAQHAGHKPGPLGRADALGALALSVLIEFSTSAGSALPAWLA